MARTKLLQKPAVKLQLDHAVEIAKDKQSVNPSLKDVRELLAIKEVSTILENILDTSSLSEPIKNYLKEVFIERKTPKKAINKVFGRDLGYQEEALKEGIMHSPAVKDFLEVVKLFYVRVAPIAAVREVEILLTGKDKEALTAAKGIKQSAGLIEEPQKGSQLPVNITINMPGSPKPEPVIEGETVNGE